MSIDYRELAPGNHRLVAKVGADRRPFRVHVPGRVDYRQFPVMGFDGVTMFNQLGSMSSINGLDDASREYGFIAIYPIPRTRYSGILSGWNTPRGLLTDRPAYDDVDYVREICEMLRIEKVHAVGFSAGGQFAHVLAGSLAGRIASVVSVSGTWLGIEPAPIPGTAALIIHGENDPVLQYRGGTRAIKTKLLERLGHRKVALSRPDLQVGAYARANGYPTEPDVFEGEVFTMRSFHPEGGTPVVEYLIRPPHGGHSYHGRKTGQGTESVLSRGNGRPLSSDVFSVNDTFAATMGLEGISDDPGAVEALASPSAGRSRRDDSRG